MHVGCASDFILFSSCSANGVFSHDQNTWETFKHYDFQGIQMTLVFDVTTVISSVLRLIGLALCPV